MLSRSLSTKLALAAMAAMLAFAPQPGAAKRPTPTPSATPTIPPEIPAVTFIARREFVAWQAGNLDHTRYTDDLNKKLTEDKVNQVATQLGHLGAFVRPEYLGPVGIEDAPPTIHGYLYRMFCSNGTVYERLILDAGNKVAGIYFMDKLPDPSQ